MSQDISTLVRNAINRVKCTSEKKLYLHAMRWVEKKYSQQKMHARCLAYLNNSDSKYLSSKIASFLKQDDLSGNKRSNGSESDKTVPEKKKRIDRWESAYCPKSGIMEGKSAELFIREAKEKLERKRQKMNASAPKKVNESFASIQERIKSGLSNSGIPLANTPSAAAICLDTEGRTINMQTGQAANLRSGKHLKVKKPVIIPPKEPIAPTEKKKHDSKAPKSVEKDPHYDSNLNTKPNFRYVRPLVLNEPGKYEKMGNKMRSQARLENLQSAISNVAKETGILKAAKLASIQPSVKSVETVNVQTEWWDCLILNGQNYENFSLDNLSGITNLIEHPVEVKPSDYPVKPIDIELKLTKKECKKLRRQERSITLKEQQEKVRLGLIPPPPPKVRISNLMRVLGSEAVLDPTKVESYVRRQMEKRQLAHMEANESRKLTHNQKIDKQKNKIKNDTACGYRTTAYLIKSLANPSHKFKVEANAKELMMTGILAMCHDFCLVVVEGGLRQQKKYKRLMMHRIKWNDNETRITDKYSNLKDNKCEILWEGFVKNPSFSEFEVKICPNEKFAREIFRRNCAEHYWDLAFAKAVIDNS